MPSTTSTLLPAAACAPTPTPPTPPLNQAESDLLSAARRAVLDVLADGLLAQQETQEERAAAGTATAAAIPAGGDGGASAEEGGTPSLPRWPGDDEAAPPPQPPLRLDALLAQPFVMPGREEVEGHVEELRRRRLEQPDAAADVTRVYADGGKDAQPKKKKRGRPRKDAAGKSKDAEAPPKKKRGRPRKDEAAEPPKKKRGRPRKKLPTRSNKEEDATETEESDTEQKPAGGATKKRRNGKVTALSQKDLEYKARVKKRSDEKFDAMMAELESFKARHGHCDVPQGAGSGEGAKLGVWVNQVRKNYQWLRPDWNRGAGRFSNGGAADADATDGEDNEDDNNEDPDDEEGNKKNTKKKTKNKTMEEKRRLAQSFLTAERLQRLYDIGFRFSCRRAGRNYTWDERYEHLRRAKDSLGLGGGTFTIDDLPRGPGEEAGRAAGPSGDGGQDDGGGPNGSSGDAGDGQPHDWVGLRKWLVVQKELHHKVIVKAEATPGFRGYTAERARRLADLGLAFPAESRADVQWEDKFHELLRYRDVHGNCLVPKAHKGLGEWVLANRKKYKKMLGDFGGDEGEVLVRSDRMRRLAEVGFVFSIRNRRSRNSY